MRRRIMRPVGAVPLISKEKDIRDAGEASVMNVNEFASGSALPGNGKQQEVFFLRDEKHTNRNLLQAQRKIDAFILLQYL